MARAAGTSALAMYRSARRRRLARLSGALALATVAAGAVAAGAPRLAVAVAAGVGLLFLAGALLGPSVRDPARWRRGAQAEMRTSSLLGALPSRGWKVWHDLPVPGSRANIDHLVVGRTGVWVVDTKSTLAVVRAGWRSVHLGDRRLDVAPTRWETDVVADRLEERVGELLRRPLAVRPIIAVHGAGLRPRGVRVGGIRVVPADRLVRHIQRGRRRLGRRDRRLVCGAVDEEFGRR